MVLPGTDLDAELSQRAAPPPAFNYPPTGNLPTVSLPHPTCFRKCRFDQHSLFCLFVCLVLKHARNNSKPFSGVFYFSFLEDLGKNTEG